MLQRQALRSRATRRPFDQWWSNVVLDVDCNPFPDGATPSLFLDRGPLGLTSTWSGAARISTQQPVTGSASVIFDAASAYLTFGSGAYFDIFSGDCCVDFDAVYASSAGNQCMLEIGNGSTNRANVSLLAGAVIFYTQTNAGSGIRITGTAPPVNTLNRFRLAKAGSTIALYANGVAVGTTTTTVLPSGSLYCSVGSNRFTGGGAEDFAGRIGLVRVTKGVSRVVTDYPSLPPRGGSWPTK